MTTFHLPPNKFKDSSTGHPTDLGSRFTSLLLDDTPNGSLIRASPLRTLPERCGWVLHEDYRVRQIQTGRHARPSTPLFARGSGQRVATLEGRDCTRELCTRRRWRGRDRIRVRRLRGSKTLRRRFSTIKGKPHRMGIYRLCSATSPGISL